MAICSLCRSMADSWRSIILDRSLLMIRLTLHLWSKLRDLRCLKERQRWASSFDGSHHGRPTLSRSNILTSRRMMLTSKRDKVWNFNFSLVTLLMIKLTLYLWSKLPDLRCLKERQRRASSFNGSPHGRSMPSRLKIGYIMMHDVNIEERIKAKCQVLTLSLLSSSSTLHLTPLTAKG